MKDHFFQLCSGLCGHRTEHLPNHPDHQGNISPRHASRRNMSPEQNFQRWKEKWKRFTASDGDCQPDHTVHIHPLLLLENRKIRSKIWRKALRNRKVQKKLQNSEKNRICCNSRMLFSQLQLHVQRYHHNRRRICSIRRSLSFRRRLHRSLLHRPLSPGSQGRHPKRGGNSKKGDFLCFKTKAFRTSKAIDVWVNSQLIGNKGMQCSSKT